MRLNDFDKLGRKAGRSPAMGSYFRDSAKQINRPQLARGQFTPAKA